MVKEIMANKNRKFLLYIQKISSHKYMNTNVKFDKLIPTAFLKDELILMDLYLSIHICT